DDMNPEHAIGLRVADNLDHTFHVIYNPFSHRPNELASLTNQSKFHTPTIGLGATIGHERECSDIILNSTCFDLLLSLAYPGNFWMRINHTWDTVIVYVPVTTSNVFRRGNAFLLGLMRQHGAAGNISNAADVRVRGYTEIIGYFNTSTR